MAFNRSAIKDSHIKVGAKSIKVSDATDAQLRAAAKANPNILRSGWYVDGDKIYQRTNTGTMTETKPVTGSTKQQTDHAAEERKRNQEAERARAEQQRKDAEKQRQQLNTKITDAVAKGDQAPGNPAAARPIWSDTLALNDPWYREKKAGLDYTHKGAKAKYDELMGVDGAKGSILQNWQHAIDALTRGTRNNISSTNAGLSGSNLAGSGVARRALSDIAAEFYAGESKFNLDRERDERDATREWTDAGTLYNQNASAILGQAAERWKVNNDGVFTPGKPNLIEKPTPPKKPTGGIEIVPPGTPAPTWRPGTGPHKGVTTVPAGTPRPSRAPRNPNATTFKDAQGNIRRIGSGTIITRAR